MKKAIVAVELPKERLFEIPLLKGGIIRNFVMGIAEKKIVTQVIGQGQRIMEEVPTIFVEVDPDEKTIVNRHFVIAQEGQVIESDGELKFVGSVMSQASQGAVFHLFEEIL